MARKRHHRKSHRSARRHNPITATGNAISRILVPSAVLGVSFAVISKLSDKVLTGPKSATDPTPKFTPYQRAGIEAAAGLVAGGVASMLKAPAEVTLALAAGGLGKGALDGINEFQARQAAAAVTGGAPGHAAIGPGGLPQGYAAVGPRAYAGVR